MHKYTKGKNGFKIVSPTVLCELTYKINREKILKGKHKSKEREQSPTKRSLHSHSKSTLKSLELFCPFHKCNKIT